MSKFSLDLINSDPQKLSYLMVGRFLRQYSLLESAINDCIAAGLRLDSQQAAIVTANIQMRDKIHVIKSLVAESVMEPDKAEAAIKTINQFAEFSLLRNMMAHNFFWTTDSGDGVSFSLVKAKGKVKFPTTTWSVEEFEKQDTENLRFITFFEKLKDQLTHADLVRALMRAQSYTSSNPWLSGQETPNPPLPLAQGLLNTPLPEASPQTNDQSFPDPKG